MGATWGPMLADQLAWHWTNQARPRLDGLTDDEYRWEPAPSCWSIRRRGDQTSAHADGAGDTVIDWEVPAPSPPPVTTIAWRIGHLAMALGMRAANHFGTPAATPDLIDWPLTAAGGLALLDDMHARWAEGVARLDDDALLAPCGPSEGPFAEAPMAGLVLHLNREAIHHLAEIALLRDLWAARPLRG